MSVSHLSPQTTSRKSKKAQNAAGPDLTQPMIRPDFEDYFPHFKHINRGRVAIFIDGQSLFYAAWHLGIEINYSKLLQCLTANAKLLRPFFYTGVDGNNDKQKSFLHWLRRNGFRVVAKELVTSSDGHKKADLKVEIAIDMLSLVSHYDTAILISGDGDLAYAVDAVAYSGVRVEVVSLRSLTSDRLLNNADCYIDLEDIKDYIQKSPDLVEAEETVRNSASHAECKTHRGEQRNCDL